ncbi:Histone-arginine methyltransferase CARM1 (Coactivator-associated arginine methyltransferase 1) (Protein arginine N-methyltransferase 4) [Durusdinium trenchii]|uniref:Histone-arginine methyltransferase CARM1 (Coactivator-associated arginine methyltransferase 1) (Protein arginine N-methyltransferase 4) n=1 Tax=Durusdinium trenchii TaxID=1381693 RepID=A0ABP0QYR8_9DINO
MREDVARTAAFYKVEASKFAAQEASKVLENKDPVSVILGRSQEIHLPEPVDLVVHEILGEIASREGVVTSLLDAERFVPPAAKLQCWSVPSGAQTMIAPAEMPTPRYFENFRARTGTFLAMPAAGTRMLRFPNLPVSESILAEPQIFEDLKWGKACSMKIHQRRLTRFRVTREGLLSGFVFFIMVHFPVDIAPVSSADEESHWANSFCTVDRPVTVTPGDFLEVESEVDLSSDTPTYVLAAKLRRMGGACHATSSVCWSDVEDYDPNTYCKSELKARRSGELDATLCLSLSCGRRCVVRYLS